MQPGTAGARAAHVWPVSTTVPDQAAPAQTTDDAPFPLLAEAVRLATGNPDAAPRAGQAALRRDIGQAMRDRTHVAAVAPTGSGKSFAALSAAFEAAVLRDERTVLSTDSLALMGQLQDKDVPCMLDAAARVHPHRQVQVAFVKGTGNYVDPARVIATAQTLLGGLAEPSYLRLADRLEATTGAALHGLADLGDTGDPDRFRRLVVWALRQYTTDGNGQPGDRHSCPVAHTADGWAAVSATSDTADDGKRFGVTSKAADAREAASSADIVVTNHSILAVQAAHGIPVIIGNTRIGPVDHVIVDEAHALPGHVRAQGAVKLGGYTVVQAARKAHRAAGSPSGRMKHWADAASGVADTIDHTLQGILGREKVARIGRDDNPFTDLQALVKEWADQGDSLLAEYADPHASQARQVDVAAASAKLGVLRDTVRTLGRGRSGWARWVEATPARDKTGVWVTANASPVTVGWMLHDNLWAYTGGTPDTDTGDVDPDRHPGGDVDLGEDQEPHRPMSVTAMSATLPATYPAEAGLAASVTVHPSPFTEAYAHSALYVPLLETPHDLAHVAQPGYNGRARFDTKTHQAWTGGVIVRLVDANGGNALVLSATAAAGRDYTTRLRGALPGIRVHSQWDGGQAATVVAAWRADPGSVLVGTRSMMTGVDAPGAQCSLVVIDRVPRSPSNPIDDARLEDIQTRTGWDRWTADRFVYATDAALLLAQAAGRLIRAEADRGMLVCADPRLLKTSRGGRGPLTYPEPTRKLYMGPLYPFGVKFTGLDQAAEWLGRQAAARGRARHDEKVTAP